MKVFSKTIAVVMSAFMILSCAVTAASAAQAAPCPQVKVICSDGTNCGDYNALADKLCNSCGSYNELVQKLCNGCGACPEDIQKYINSCCPGGNGCATVPDFFTQKPTEPAVQPTEPNNSPAEPVVVPTAPVVQPTEPAAPEQSQNSEFNTAYEAEVLRLVNAERAKYGLASLSMDDGAVKVAHLRSKEIVQSFSHTRPNGSSCFTAASEFGVSYRTAGENIAYGYSTPEQVVNGWMNSEGHRKNILSASFSKIGIGCYNSGGVLYWSQFFIG